MSNGSMLEKHWKKHAYTVIDNNEKGFSMISMLITITIIFVTLPFFAYLLSHLSYTSHQEFLSVNQFFLFLRDELIESPRVEIVDPQSINYELRNGEIAEISKYNDIVRRRVQGKGHEVFLRDVKKLSLKRISNGIQVELTTKQGEIYEKQIILYY